MAENQRGAIVLNAAPPVTVTEPNLGRMGTKRLHYSENFSEQAADFTLLSLPEPLLATLVEQDGGCASSIAV